MMFNAIIDDRNGNILYSNEIDIDELNDIFPEVIENEGDFWRTDFWEKYNFLFCISDKKSYFITGENFNWDRLVSDYPELWDNILLKNLYKNYNRDKKLKDLLKK